MRGSVYAWQTSTAQLTRLVSPVVNALQQLVAVPRRMLDPRRTFDKPSKQDQEELLLPYEAALPSDPRWVVSHHAEVR